MRKWKLALAAAVLVAPLGSLNAVSTTDTLVVSTAATASKEMPAVEDGAKQQGWGCCWVFWYGRWMCVPC